MSEEHGSETLTHHFELHLIELPKLPTAVDRNDVPGLTAWAEFLSAAADEDLEELAMEDPVLKQAKDALERLSADPDARIRAEMRELALLSHELGLNKACSEGRAEGKAEGQAELLQRLLSLKFGELPPAVRARLTQATQAELLRWSERFLSADSLDTVFEGYVGDGDNAEGMTGAQSAATQ